MSDRSSEIIEPEADHVNIPEVESVCRARSLAVYRRDVASWTVVHHCVSGHGRGPDD